MNWTETAVPPYAGLYWAYTVHGTVEMVHVSPKKPKHLGRADPLMAPADPFVYQFGDNPELNFETLARRRWTHWLPVTPPDPPRQTGFAGEAGGLPPGDDPVRASIEQELDRQSAAARLPGIGIDWRRMAEQAFIRSHQAAAQEEMDRADASAYDPGRYAEVEAAATTPTTPRQLLETANALAVRMLGETLPVRITELKWLKDRNFVLWVLVTHAIRVMTKKDQKDSGEAA